MVNGRKCYAAMAGARLTHLAFADPGASGYNEEILVAIFLRKRQPIPSTNAKYKARMT